MIAEWQGPASQIRANPIPMATRKLCTRGGPLTIAQQLAADIEKKEQQLLADERRDRRLAQQLVQRGEAHGGGAKGAYLARARTRSGLTRALGLRDTGAAISPRMKPLQGSSRSAGRRSTCRLGAPA